MVTESIASFRRSVRDFWAASGGLTILLFSLVTFLFFLYPLVEYFGLRATFLSIGFSAVMISAVLAIAERPNVRRTAAALAALALLAHWYHTVDPLPVVRILGDLLVILFLALTIIVLLARVLRPGRVTYHRIEGAVAVYLLIAVMWAEAFGLLEFLVPGSIDLGGASSGDEGGFSGGMLYFSFVTLTTLGYGDITPQNVLSRQLCVLEAITGVLFIGTLIARLVSLEVAGRGQANANES